MTTLSGTLAASFVLASPAARPAEPPPPRRIAVRASALLDVVAGTMVRDPVVLIEGDRITAVGPGLAAPGSATWRRPCCTCSGCP